MSDDEDINSNRDFARRIDEARKTVLVMDRGKMRPLSQNKLEAAVGMKPGYLARIRSGDRGASIKREWLVALARELKVELLWLLSGPGPMRMHEGSPPIADRRALGLYIASKYFDATDSALEAAKLAFPDRDVDPLRVADFAKHVAEKERNRISAIASRADITAEAREELQKAARKGERVRAKREKTKPKEVAPASEKPSRRKIAVDER